MAHPCVSEVEASLGKTLTLHTGGSWAGALPSSNAALGHECGEDFNSYVYAGNTAQTSEMGEPIGDAISTFNVSRLTGLGYSARNVPLTGTGNGVYNSDLAFKDNLVIQGTYEGFRIVDFTNKSNPTQIINYTGCSVGQGDVVVYGNILVRSWDAPADSTATCAGRSVPQGFEGVHIWNISNPAQPEYIRDLRFSQAGMPAGALLGCGSHTATAVPGSRSRPPVHLQRRLERHLLGHRRLPDQDLRPERCGRDPPRLEWPAGQLLPRQQRADGRRRRHRRLCDVRGRQRPLDVRVRHGQGGG